MHSLLNESRPFENKAEPECLITNVQQINPVEGLLLLESRSGWDSMSGPKLQDTKNDYWINFL